MKHKSKTLLTIIGAVIVLLLGLILWQMHENNPQVQAEKASKAASRSEVSAKMKVQHEFENAPKGNYIHLTPDSDTLYKTSWSKAKMVDYLRHNAGDDDKSVNFGTNKVFTTNKDNVNDLIDRMGDTHDVLPNVYSSKSPENYNFYFNSPADAQKDANVKQNVTHIVY